VTQIEINPFLVDNIVSNILGSQMSFARKDKVRILRPESYWFNQIGEIVSIDKSPNMRYPVTVKFVKCDFKAFSGVDGGANTSMFAMSEIEAASN
tara:strand:+ start:134 stop:418 length:285 start_codon:yes stop_codon:yes gene_type:complete